VHVEEAASAQSVPSVCSSEMSRPGSLVVKGSLQSTDPLEAELKMLADLEQSYNFLELFEEGHFNNSAMT
jgi:hypothetical protein